MVDFQGKKHISNTTVKARELDSKSFGKFYYRDLWQ